MCRARVCVCGMRDGFDREQCLCAVSKRMYVNATSSKANVGGASVLSEWDGKECPRAG